MAGTPVFCLFMAKQTPYNNCTISCILLKILATRVFIHLMWFSYSNWNNGLPTRGKIKEEKLGKRRRRLLKRVPHGQVTMELSLSVSVRSIAKRAKMVVAESWNGLHKALFMPSTRHPHHSNQEWGQWKLVLALASMFTQGGVGS